MNRVNEFLAEFPSTNAKSAIGILMGVVAVLVLLGGVVFERAMNETIVGMVLGFIATWMGISYAQFSMKRKTEIVTPPQTTAENATTTPAEG